MAGTLIEDCTGDGRSSSTEDLPSDQQSNSGDSLAEWRSSEQVENGTPSTSPTYSSSDDECGPRASELYGKFTWRIDNFSQINKRELRSNSFDVGGYKWYILIYPQGCDVCNHLSLFLCVANHDKLLPGWGHFAQFTIAVINKDPKKSKYSDTLHRFWKKEHDWGWKKFMELSKLHDGFVVEDVMTIKAQVQVVREKVHRPFRCLDGQYRRELVRVYLSNVEQICRHFIDERRIKLYKLFEDKPRWASFSAFWLEMDPNVRLQMTKEKTDTILKALVKHFFIEKEVTSTLVIDSLYSGLKGLEYQSKNTKWVSKPPDTETPSTSLVFIYQDMFVLADDVLVLLDRAKLDTLPKQPLSAKDDKSSQNRTKDDSSGDDSNKDSIERDDIRIIELGWKTMEYFAMAHIFSQIEVAYQEAVALKRQEELIREEEAAGIAKVELKAKRSAAEKERRIRKKQAKQKKINRKNNKGKNEKADMKEIVIESGPSSPAELTSNIDNSEETSDCSDNRDHNSEAHPIYLEDRESSPVNWETDALETRASGPDGVEAQNGKAGKRMFLDDSSSTCSSDSVPSVILNGIYTGGAWTNVKSSSNRGNNRRNKGSDARIGHSQSRSHSVPNGSFRSGNSKDHRHLFEDNKVVLHKKKNVQRHGDARSASKLRIADSSFSSVNPAKKQPIFPQQRKSSLESTNKLSSRAIEVAGAATTATSTRTSVTSTPPAQLVPSKGHLTLPAAQNERSVPVASKPLLAPGPSKPEAKKPTSMASGAAPTQVITVTRPLTAPQIPAVKQKPAAVSTVQTAPPLSRSMSAVGRLGDEPSAGARSYVPRSYRNVMMEKNSAAASGSSHQSSSSGLVFTQAAQSMFASSPSILSPEKSGRRDKPSLKPGFSFGTMKAEALNQYQWRQESFQQASSSSGHGLLSSSIGNEFEKLSLNGRPQSRQLLSDISTRFTPYQPPGPACEDFPHLDIINDLLDEEYSVRRRVLLPGYTGHSIFPDDVPNTASRPDCDVYGDPRPFDQPAQYYEEEPPPPLYGELNGAPLGLRDRSYSQFDLPSYSSSQFDDATMNQWSYSRTESSMPNSAAGMNDYTYQSTDYPNSSTRDASYPSYRPANGH